MYTFPQKQGVLYTLVELSGGLCYLESLKICPFSLKLENGLVWMWYLFDILPIQSVVFFTYGRMEKILLQLQYSRNVANNGSRDGDNT